MTAGAPANHRPTVLPIVAGIVLVLEGIVALLLAATFLWVSVSPPVAAVQGRAPIDQTQYGFALAFAVFAVAALVAGVQVLRGGRAGRRLGVVVAAIAMAAVVSSIAAGVVSGGDVILPLLGLVNALVAMVLISSPRSRGAARAPD